MVADVRILGVANGAFPMISFSKHHSFKYPNLNAYRIIILGAFSFLYFLLYINQPLNLYDEGAIVYGAMRIVNGEIPYRDFWAGYAPGQYYLIATLFQWIAPSITVERVWDVVVRTSIVLVAYRISAQLNSKITLLVWFLVTICLTPPGFYFGYPFFPALLLALTCAWCLLTHISTRQSRWLILSGAFNGLTLIWKHDIGIFCLLAAGATLGLASLTDLAPTLSRFFDKLRFAVKNVMLFVLGALMILLPTLGAFTLAGSLGALWTNLLVFPLTVLGSTRALPYPSIVPQTFSEIPGWLYFYLPILIAMFVLVGTIRKRIQLGPSQVEMPRLWGTVFLGLLTFFFFYLALSRNDPVHLVQSFIPALLLLLISSPSLFGFPKLSFRLIGYVALWSVVAVFWIYPTVSQSYVGAMQWRWSCESPLPRVGCVLMSADQKQAAEFIQSHTAPNEPIFVGNTSHTKVFVNDIMFYFIASRPSVTRYHELHPSIVDTSAGQQQIIEEIRSHQLTYLVLYSGFSKMAENSNQSQEGASLLDTMIHYQFIQIAEFGNYSVWQKQD
jgi:hypothetical protein